MVDARGRVMTQADTSEKYKNEIIDFSKAGKKKRKFTAIRCIRIRRHCFPQFRFQIRRQKEKEFCLREASHPPTSRRQAANSIPDVQNAWNAAKHRRRSGMKWMTDITYIVIFMIKKEGNSRNETFYQCRYRGLCRSGTDR